MSIRDHIITMSTALVLTPFVLLSIHIGGAQVMQSSNYKIESDSVNFGGGLSSSTNYTLESTCGEVATGEGSSASYNLRAGYQQMTGRTISITAPSDVSMTPSIPGVTGGTANGSTTVTVTTDSAAGYTLSIKAENSPAMRKGADSIADYVPAGLNPDFDFDIGSFDAYFGYSPSSVDTVSRFLDDTAVCGTGGSDDTPLKCWDGLSTSDVVISQATSANIPNGATTTVNFRVGIGGSVIQAAGTYVATTTLTAVAL